MQVGWSGTLFRGARRWPDIAVAFASLLAVFFVVFAIGGGVDSYSPIPFWDMWEGYIGSFVQLSDGAWMNWWKPHNEHRIVFAKLLFWLDLSLFHGSIVFLMIANFVFAALGAWLLAAMLRQAVPAGAQPAPVRILAAAVVCLLFSWVQSENFGWGFQSAFFLAQLVPLFAFYLLYRARVAPTRGNPLFIGAVLAGFASIGTMANGVLVLPLLAVLAGMLRFDKARVAVLVALSVAAAFLYFSGPPLLKQQAGIDGILANPLALLHYVVLYLGSPFYYVRDGGSRLAADVAGIFFLVGSAGVFIGALLHLRVKPVAATSVVPVTLLFFVAYIVATAAITGYGRLAMGVEQAISSRYTTAALMGWCALLVAAASLARSDKTRWYAGASAVLLALLLVPRQLILIDMPNPYPFERLIAGLALEMGVRDGEQIAKVTPRINRTVAMVEIARARELSAFGRAPLQGLRERIEQQQQVVLPARRCRGNIESVAAVPKDERYRSVVGWIYEPDAKAAPATVALVDTAGRLVGYGLSGGWRDDVAQVLGTREHRAGFRAYLLASYTEGRIFLVGGEACQWEGELPPAAGGAG